MENGDALYQKFMSSRQAPVRLELALSGFFSRTAIRINSTGTLEIT